MGRKCEREAKKYVTKCSSLQTDTESKVGKAGELSNARVDVSKRSNGGVLNGRVSARHKETRGRRTKGAEERMEKTK